MAIGHCRPAGRRTGLILLEVVLAVALFVLSAVLVGASVRSSLSASQRMSQRTRGLALAQSVLARIRANVTEGTDNLTGDFGLQFPSCRYKLAVSESPDVASLRRITATVTWDVWPDVPGSETDSVSLTGWEYRPKVEETGTEESPADAGAGGAATGGGTAGP